MEKEELFNKLKEKILQGQAANNEGPSDSTINFSAYDEGSPVVPCVQSSKKNEVEDCSFSDQYWKATTRCHRIRKKMHKWREYKIILDERRLCQAVLLNDTHTVNHLLKQGVSARCYDSIQRTPLHLAACKGYTEIVETLLKFGANPNAKDSIGNTPLHLAACTNHIDVIDLLLQAGTDACSIDKLGRSPLQLAQSKLKILQKSHDPGHEVKEQVQKVIKLLLMFSHEEEMKMDRSVLEMFQKYLKLSDTREEVDTHLNDLLDNLNSLTIENS